METWRQNHVQIATMCLWWKINMIPSMRILSFGLCKKNLGETTASARRRSASSKAKAKAAKPVAWYLKTWNYLIGKLKHGGLSLTTMSIICDNHYCSIYNFYNNILVHLKWLHMHCWCPIHILDTFDININKRHSVLAVASVPPGVVQSATVLSSPKCSSTACGAWATIFYHMSAPGNLNHPNTYEIL